MPTYNHDYMHCNQHKCKRKDQCYRYWLSQNFKGTDYQYASFYHPKEKVTDGCEYFMDIKSW